jgi:hypothetical protein
LSVDDARKNLHMVSCGRVTALATQKMDAANDNPVASKGIPFASLLERIANAIRPDVQREESPDDMSPSVGYFGRNSCSHQSLRAVPAAIGRIAMIVVCVFVAIFGAVTGFES